MRQRDGDIGKLGRSGFRPSAIRFSAIRFGALLLAVALAGTGCDRGDQPQQLGRAAPLFALDDGQHRVDLRNLRGQVVVLNFWASWCAPCLAEMPALEALQQDLPAVRVVLVAFDEDASTYGNYLARHPLPLLTVLDTKQIANALYGTFRPPETYVIDKAGVIRHKYIGSQDWTSPEIENTLRRLAG